MYLLDTNVVSVFRRIDKAPQQILDWAESVDAEDFYLSVITILEIEQGILMKQRKDKVQADLYRNWLNNDVLVSFEDRILPIDLAVAQRCARLHVPDPKSERDALIAATALVHGMAVATRNEADFKATGVPLIDPWSYNRT
ncbi:type II toxin-antitoxin system VapC family toxin [Sphingobium yanoikuyae]|uniref:VapC toxin family PIN domain ribonuclease n=1 Tax=Sphingobium yanoikuyae TaxID=13690 RepID=A0A291N0A3_SPHYA|nr:type II toxin-antitoxin system VapC family toxin [Sphingobium yanoikuyae]ATI80588.1 VapC toxin family PIN domain ribonuclease [Sphingobium yanoikuyae]